MKKFTRKYNRVGNSVYGYLEDILFIDDIREVYYFVPGRNMDWYAFHGISGEQEQEFKLKRDIDKMLIGIKNLGYRELEIEEMEKNYNV